MENGIFDNISIKDYHADREYTSASSIKEAKKSLAHFRYYLDNKQEDKPQFSFGNAFELALLDQKGFESEVAIEQDSYWIALANEEYMAEKGKTYTIPRNSARYKAEYSKWETANEGKYKIAETGKESYETIEKMLASCRKDSTVQKLIEGTEYQLSLFWQDEECGLKLKTRPDICKRKKNVIVNLKTTINGSPEAFSRDLVKYDYPLQACVEISGCLATGLMNSVDNYFWLVLEKEPPFCATIYEFQESDIKSTMMEYEYLITKIAEAKEKDFYPGYSDRADNKHGILTARVPSYYLQH